MAELETVLVAVVGIFILIGGLAFASGISTTLEGNVIAADPITGLGIAFLVVGIAIAGILKFR
jgi:hypothetical protein